MIINERLTRLLNRIAFLRTLALFAFATINLGSTDSQDYAIQGRIDHSIKI